jgi:acetyl-CoA carboxylase biotin carboxyl carrier protein
MIFKDVDIKGLFALMVEHDVSEVSLHDGKLSIDVKRGDRPVVVNTGPGFPQVQEMTPKAKGAAPAAGVEEPAPDNNKAAVEKEAPSNNYHPVEAPLVGTFYRAPAPEVDPFVEVGDKIKSGDVLCIVEAMKSMNEIQSDVSGTVREICVENAAIVEFEQVLFKIER